METLARDLQRLPFSNWALISICSPREDGTPDTFLTDNTIRNLEGKGLNSHLSLCFSDMSQKEFDELRPKFPYLRLFEWDHAGLVLGYLNMVQSDIEEFDLVVHCDAGISRSGAVAQFVSDMYKIPFSDGFIRPNPRVYRMLVKAWESKILAQCGE